MALYINGKESKERLLENYIQNSKKLTLKDYIAYGLTFGSIVVAIIFGLQKQKLVKNRQQINNVIQIIQQNNNYNELPNEIRQQIEKIAKATGDREPIK